MQFVTRMLTIAVILLLGGGVQAQSFWKRVNREQAERLRLHSYLQSNNLRSFLHHTSSSHHQVVVSVSKYLLRQMLISRLMFQSHGISLLKCKHKVVIQMDNGITGT